MAENKLYLFAHLRIRNKLWMKIVFYKDREADSGGMRFLQGGF